MCVTVVIPVLRANAIVVGIAGTLRFCLRVVGLVHVGGRGGLVCV